MPTHTHVLNSRPSHVHGAMTAQVRELARQYRFSSRPLFVCGLTQAQVEELFGTAGYSMFPVAGPGKTPIFVWGHEADMMEIAQLRVELLGGLPVSRRVSFWLIQVWDGEPHDRPE